MVTRLPALKARIDHRLGVWHWRLRYWWLDTESGAHAHIWAFCMALLVLALQLVRMAIAALHPAPAAQQAVVWWVVQLIIAVVAAVISYVMRPKQPKQPERKFDGPTVEDGLCADDHFGEVWIGDEFILAHKVVGTQKIKSKGGKK